jgi:FtsP/CotA-like multicopper oxidase with cupredoxin domain
MFNFQLLRHGLPTVLLAMLALPAGAQSFHVQCPLSTTLHPLVADPTAKSSTPTLPNPAIKCQQVGGGDGFSTMGDGNQIYMFSFGPLSGLGDIINGLPGTEPASIFDTVATDPTVTSPTGAHGAPQLTTTFKGAVGLVQDPEVTTDPACSSTSPPLYCLPTNAYYGLDGHVDPRQIIDVGVMNGSIPAPLMAIDEDDEFFLTLTNVGMIMRPDLFEQHTIHFHGYPNASSFYDGVPDASVAITIGGSFTYYYLAPDAGTYFWHCHISPPEHLQMGMVGQLYVRPRQNHVVGSLHAGLVAQQNDLRTKSDCVHDVLCTSPVPADNGLSHGANLSGTPTLFAYNDGDGSTAYDVEYPLQIHGFDPNFHFVGMTFNPEPFTDMKDKYFLLNGRSYPDTAATTGAPTYQPIAQSTNSSDGTQHFSQPLTSVVNIPAGGKALLRISDLDVTEFQTLASLGIPMRVVGFNARLLRDEQGNNMAYNTNSITLGGGESVDVILDATDKTKYQNGQTFYLYTPNLDHLANDAENFGGLMTEVHICNKVDPTTKACS